jgi:hypothetical protein
MAFDIAGARKAGYSDAQIVDHLTNSGDFAFDFTGARKHHADKDILNHLAGAGSDASRDGVAKAGAGGAKASPAAANDGDVGKSIVSGLGRGALDVAGVQGTVRDFNASAVSRLSKALGFEVTPEMASSVLRFVPGMQGATPKQLEQQVAKVTGDFYNPKTTAGEYAQTASRFVPAAVSGPGGVARNLALGVTGGLTSEAAGQATKGTDIEPAARMIGGVLPAGAAMAAPAVASAAKSLTPLAKDIAPYLAAEALVPSGFGGFGVGAWLAKKAVGKTIRSYIDDLGVQKVSVKETPAAAAAAERPAAAGGYSAPAGPEKGFPWGPRPTPEPTGPRGLYTPGTNPTRDAIAGIAAEMQAGQAAAMAPRAPVPPMSDLVGQLNAGPQAFRPTQATTQRALPPPGFELDHSPTGAALRPDVINAGAPAPQRMLTDQRFNMQAPPPQLALPPPARPAGPPPAPAGPPPEEMLRAFAAQQQARERAAFAEAYPAQIRAGAPSPAAPVAPPPPDAAPQLVAAAQAMSRARAAAPELSTPQAPVAPAPAPISAPPAPAAAPAAPSAAVAQALARAQRPPAPPVGEPDLTIPDFLRRTPAPKPAVPEPVAAQKAMSNLAAPADETLLGANLMRESFTPVTSPAGVTINMKPSTQSAKMGAPEAAENAAVAYEAAGKQFWRGRDNFVAAVTKKIAEKDGIADRLAKATGISRNLLVEHIRAVATRTRAKEVREELKTYAPTKASVIDEALSDKAITRIWTKT